MNLDELERLARVALAHSERIGEDEWFTQQSVQSMLLAHPDDAAFIAAANPEVILRLVAIARAAEKAFEELRAFTDREMTVGDRYSNMGQTMLNAEFLLREAMEGGK